MHSLRVLNLHFSASLYPLRRLNLHSLRLLLPTSFSQHRQRLLKHILFLHYRSLAALTSANTRVLLLRRCWFITRIPPPLRDHGIHLKNIRTAAIRSQEQLIVQHHVKQSNKN